MLFQFELNGKREPIKDDELIKFLTEKMAHQRSINFRMSSVVGIGGESIILKDTSNTTAKSVFKVTPIRGKIDLPTTIEERFGIEMDGGIDTDRAYEKHRPNELTANDLRHKNIIHYQNSMFEVVDDQIFHITGTKAITHIEIAIKQCLMFNSHAP